MLAKATLLAASVLLLSGCKLELPSLGGDTSISGPLKTRNGGIPACRWPAMSRCAGNNPGKCALCQPANKLSQGAGSRQPRTLPLPLTSSFRTQLLEYSDAEGKPPATPDEFATMFVNDYNAVPDATGLWEMERKVEVSFGAEHLATFNFSEHGYTGGAHPFSGQRYFVFDLDSGKQLTLNGLARGGL